MSLAYWWARLRRWIPLIVVESCVVRVSYDGETVALQTNLTPDVPLPPGRLRQPNAVFLNAFTADHLLDSSSTHPSGPV